jgi:4'-phosphopantetheinyl transferase EntD
VTLASLARGLLPPCIAVAGGALADWQLPLPPIEAQVVRNAVATRRQTFAAGRNAARAALGQLGVQAVLPRRADGPPVWPAGLTGSIAHTGDWCLAAVARLSDVRAVGVDLERAGGLAPDLVSEVLSPQEIAALGGDDPTGWFSAKEAAYKAQFMLTGRMLGFHDLTVTRQGDVHEVRTDDLILAVRLARWSDVIVAATCQPT